MSEYGLIECPICKKKFYPAPQHAWKITGDAKVCSYHCMRQYEVVHGGKRKYAKKGK